MIDATRPPRFTQLPQLSGFPTKTLGSLVGRLPVRLFYMEMPLTGAWNQKPGMVLAPRIHQSSPGLLQLVKFSPLLMQVKEALPASLTH